MAHASNRDNRGRNSFPVREITVPASKIAINECLRFSLDELSARSRTRNTLPRIIGKAANIRTLALAFGYGTSSSVAAHASSFCSRVLTPMTWSKFSRPAKSIVSKQLCRTTPMKASTGPTTPPALALCSTKIGQDGTASVTRAQRQLVVSFSAVEVRWYPMQLSGNSICSAGAPLVSGGTRSTKHATIWTSTSARQRGRPTGTDLREAPFPLLTLKLDPELVPEARHSVPRRVYTGTDPSCRARRCSNSAVTRTDGPHDALVSRLGNFPRRWTDGTQPHCATILVTLSAARACSMADRLSLVSFNTSCCRKCAFYEAIC
jgi:hypothetical protein